MKFEIKNRFNGELIFSIETENLRLAVEAAIKSHADLSSANLSSADLSWADLSSANLSSADLSSANLRLAKTSHRYISVSGIGSEKRLTVYDLTDDKIFCGCFTGTLKEFEEAVKKTHKNKSQYLSEYIGFINYVKGLKNETNN